VTESPTGVRTSGAGRCFEPATASPMCPSRTAHTATDLMRSALCRSMADDEVARNLQSMDELDFTGGTKLTGRGCSPATTPTTCS
jgi:hypothetical protein